MTNFVYAIVSKTNGYIVDVAFSRDSARQLKKDLEQEYTGKFHIHQMAKTKRVR